MTVRIMVGDVLRKLGELGDESVHCVVTSPP
jgi:DNA modification methylase